MRALLLGVLVATGCQGHGSRPPAPDAPPPDAPPDPRRTYIKASNTSASSTFGQSVALSADGTRLAVGSDLGEQLGLVYIFARTGETWVQEAILQSQGTARDDFGRSVALSDDGAILAVGAPGDSSAANEPTDTSLPGAGAVFVFTRSGTAWSRTAYLKASNRDQIDSFGGAIALSGDATTLAVGATGEDSAAAGIDGNQLDNSRTSAGAVYVFGRSGASWTQQSYVKASNPGAPDHFGAAIALSRDGSTLAIAAPDESSNSAGIDGDQSDDSLSSAGAAYVFARSGATWLQQAYVKPTNPDANDQFGGSLALSRDGNLFAASAPFERSGVPGDPTDNSQLQAGAVYVFTRASATWSQAAYVKTTPASQSLFGTALALSDDGTQLVAGAVEDNNFVGAAYLFAGSGAAWSQQQLVTASNGQAGDDFGVRLALSADGATLAIGADGEDSAATGIDGDESDNSAESAGAVYVFR